MPRRTLQAPHPFLHALPPSGAGGFRSHCLGAWCDHVQGVAGGRSSTPAPPRLSLRIRGSSPAPRAPHPLCRAFPSSQGAAGSQDLNTLTGPGGPVTARPWQGWVNLSGRAFILFYLFIFKYIFIDFREEGSGRGREKH
uniref:Uncharacterized protein n=1 Tax=Myotis myotis TaxID=51298 RepID=A0A7J7QWJ1_MYOMY|nr:hypothetical protein mMyoMyo1_011289 [Myotis myotis]